MKIVTLTLNPAFDIHCKSEKFSAEHENTASVISREAGGKGINISRALAENGINNTAFIILGSQNADEFRNALKFKNNIETHEIITQGRIRENITIHTEGRPETRLSFTGFSADDNIIKNVTKQLLKIVSCGDTVTVTGRLPDGVSVKAAKEMIFELSANGVKTVIDSKSFSLADMIECKPFLIKPNGEEISEYLGKEITDFPQIIYEAKQLHNKGIENVTVSLGEKGALLVCGDGLFIATPPEIEPVSTIGAGDSSIAGFLAAKQNGECAAECLKNAVANGTAACLTYGTEPPKLSEINRIKEKIRLEKL